VAGALVGLVEDAFEFVGEDAVETTWIGLLDGNLVDGDSNVPTIEDLDGTSGFDTELDGTKEGNLDGISGLGHVGEDEDATVGWSEGLWAFETVVW
jgi:hypothetical protein